MNVSLANLQTNNTIKKRVRVDYETKKQQIMELQINNKETNIMPNVESISSNYFTYSSNSKLKKDFFNSNDDTKKYLKWLFKKLNYNTYEDLYNLNRTHFRNNYGNVLLTKYISVFKILSLYIPEHKWYGFKFNPVHREYYSKQENIRECCDYMFQELKYNKVEDFYNISQKDINSFTFGSRIMAIHKTIPDLFKYAYPEYNWLPWKFNKCFYYFITKEGNLIYKNIRTYTDWLFKELNYNTYENIYKIQKKDFENNYGGSLLSHKFKNCIFDLIKYSYPEYKWLPWKFKQTTRYFWSKNEEPNRDNILIYIKWLENELKIQNKTEWYKYNCNTLREYYGVGLLWLFNGSISSLLKWIYSDYNFDESKFKCCPNGYWNNFENQKRYIENEIQDDFDKIYNIELPAALKNKYENLEELIKTLFPDKQINIELIRKGRGRKGQIILEKHIDNIKEYFKDKFNITYERESKIENIFNIKHSFRIDYKIIICDKSNNLLNILYIEIDGIQHFENVSIWLPFEKQQNRDIYKMKFILNNNNKIIRIYQPDIINDKYYNHINEIIINEINNIVKIKEYHPAYYCLSDNTKYDIHKELYKNNTIENFSIDDLY
jgi:hypothetical protein